MVMVIDYRLLVIDSNNELHELLKLLNSRFVA